jgi:hypothetical protein
MIGRQFETKALLQNHALVVQEYFDTSNSEEIDPEVANDLAATAALFSHRLTIEWANSIKRSQANAGDPDSDAHREHSATNLARPFKPSSYAELRLTCSRYG